jgi:hypothetical protein
MDRASHVTKPRGSLAGRSSTSQSSRLASSNTISRGILYHGESPQARQLELSKPTSVKISPNTVIQTVALCPLGKSVVTITQAKSYLFGSKKTEGPSRRVEYSTLDLETGNATTQHAINLPEGIKWAHIATCADMIVVWGKGSKLDSSESKKGKSKCAESGVHVSSVMMHSLPEY